MGFAHKSDQWPILRKVFRVGRQFVCGICRAPFESHDAARHCLEECWQEVLTQDGVMMRPASLGQHCFRCRFCSRDYNDRGQAEACAKACRGRLIARAEQDRLMMGEVPSAKKALRARPAARRQAEPLAALRKTPRKPATTAAKAKPAAASEATIQSDIVRQVTAAAEGKVVQVTKTDETGDGPSATARGRPRTEFKKTFIRDGAKYVCSYCRKHTFTKGEVEACFDTHFDANGYEIVQG